MWVTVLRLGSDMIFGMGYGPQGCMTVLFSISHGKDAPVGAHMDYSGGAIQWNVNSLWTTSFIVRLLVLYGMFSLISSGCLELCLDGQMCLLVGGLLTVRKVQMYGRWCHCVFCGVFGGKVMNNKCFGNHKRTLEELKSFFNTLYLLIAAFVSPLVISYLELLVFLPLISRWLVYVHGPLTLLMMIINK